jgi:uncharacterized protein YndB with AHSA1/START domain
MTKTTATTGSVIIEREIPHPPERVWRALTQGTLIEEWFIKNDFQPVVGHRFNFRVVTWTLTPTEGGVLVRMEQSGFRPEDEANYQGANYGWQRYIGGLERVAAGLG